MKNKLTIYLIKQEINDFEEIISVYDSKDEIDCDTNVYLKYSTSKKPQWISNFYRNIIDTDKLFVASASSVLLKRINLENNQKRIFAIVMGYGKSMLNDGVIEERFGLKVCLNSINHNSLRRISKKNIGGNQKMSNIQLPLKSTIDGFGVDVNCDLINNMTGIASDVFKGGISGSDSFICNDEVDINNIGEFLEKTFAQYISEHYKEYFGWIDKIKDVKDSVEISRLNENLIENINNKSGLFWMATPEIVDWTDIDGFKYNANDIDDDIDMQRVLSSFRHPLTSVSQLKSKYIDVISSNNGTIIRRWQSYKCIYGECVLDGKTYCINDGKWYCINELFVKKINESYAKTPISQIVFTERTSKHKSENQYIEDFASKNSDEFLVMDKKNIKHGGGQSSVELCDLITTSQELIHIKPYSGSSTLSHLFNQGVISAELIISDKEFCEKANKKIAEQKNSDSFKIKNESEIKVTYAIISKNEEKLPRIPFFSKVAFNNAQMRLKQIGVNVSLINIHDIRDN